MAANVRIPHQTIIAPTDASNPRNGEGAIVPLSDGRLLLAWSRFTDGHDHSPSEIWARTSADGGYTWSEPWMLQENIGRCNVMSVSLLRLASGALLFGFLLKNHEGADCRMYVRRSTDDGATWESPVLVTPDPTYHVINNDRLVQLSTGRLVVPAAKSADASYHGLAGCFYSDDEGRTWVRPHEWHDAPGGAGAQEPGIVECPDGSLWMWARTSAGCIYANRSQDGGLHWTPFERTGLIAPTAPASAKRLPGSDAIVMLYNDRAGVPREADLQRFEWRTPLTAAVSHDGGRTWGPRRLVESDETRSYCYTSIAFHGANTLLTYYVGRAGGPNLLDLKLTIVPTAEWAG